MSQRNNKRRAAVAAGSLPKTMKRSIATLMLCSLATVAGAAGISAPSAVYRPPVTTGAPVVTFLTADTAPRYALALSAPSASEMASLTAPPPTRSGPVSLRNRRLKIGFARAGPAGDKLLPSRALPWQVLADLGQAARIQVQSPGAKAIRLGIELRTSVTGVALRFAGSARPQQIFGPYLASDVASAGRYWSPIVDGDTVIMEVYLPKGVSPDAIQLAIPSISHLVWAGGSPRAEPVDEIGQAGPCETDIACVATPAITSQARAVAKMYFSEGGNSFLCTGTLINDSVSSNTPYFFTASHCMDSQEAATTLQTYWFFDAVACNSLTVPPYATVTGGAMLLARSDDYDWALLRLNQSPPAGATLSAWRAEPIPNGSQVSVIHHPEGDLKKISQAVAAGTGKIPLASGTYNVAGPYTLGATEAGSSGAALLTLSPSGTFELRGALFAGSSSCRKPTNSDYYSRLDAALPLLAQYLSPNTPSPGKQVVVEYYEPGLDEYFMTADANEISGLDAGVHPGWVRTGLRFLAYSDPSLAPPGVSPVCRFYILPQYGTSHFYSADPVECAQTQVKFAGKWAFETGTAFYIALPDTGTGACPVNTHAVYRFLNNANQLHHRYTAEQDLRNCLYYGVNPGVSEPDYCTGAQGAWIQEGYGTPPEATVMCSPDS
jgi:lysyl endopeptidase